MKKLLLLVVPVGLLLLAGCASQPKITQAFVRVGVSTAVQFGVSQDTNAIPYIRAVTPVVCAAANGTNFSPAYVVDKLQHSSANELSTPGGILIMNSVLAIYEVAYEALGGNSLTNNPTAGAYLMGACEGLTAGLPSGFSNALRGTRPNRPHLRFQSP